MSEGISKNEVSERLADERMLVEPSAAELISNQPNAEEILEEIVDSDAKQVDGDTVKDTSAFGSPEPQGTDEGTSTQEDTSETTDGPQVETPDVSDEEGEELEIEKLKQELDEDGVTVESGLDLYEKEEETDESSGDEENFRDRWPEEYNRVIIDEDYEVSERNEEHRQFEIRGDVTGQSNTEGKMENFISLFRDRNQKLTKLLKKKIRDSVLPIEALFSSSRRGKEVTIAGLVREVRTTQNENKFIMLEDNSGTFPIVFTDDEQMELIERVVKNEVVGVTGQVSDDGNILFGNQIFFPDVPRMRDPNSAERDAKAVLISDTHFGSELFANEKWKDFVKWISAQEDIEYLLIAGDLVEGAGVYPGQKEELEITDIRDQYKMCAEALGQLPDSLTIIASVGNHDRVRLAEPQPTLKEEVVELFPNNVKLIGNPALADIEGVKFQLYHGMSLNAFADSIPGLDIREPTEIMELLLEKRHVAPMYGEHVRIAPENEDYLVIEEVPDVLHSGHVHKFGASDYNGIKVVNTGCWVYQTAFQKKLNIEPDVGYATVININDLDVSAVNF